MKPSLHVVVLFVKTHDGNHTAHVESVGGAAPEQTSDAGADDVRGEVEDEEGCDEWEPEQGEEQSEEVPGPGFRPESVTAGEL